MRKEILSKIKMAEEYLKAGNFSDGASMLKYLDRWIGYFQHERLVHLIVTVTFAVLTLLCMMSWFISCEIMFIAMTVLFLITTAFYVEHYYLLENKTQYLYTLYDKILEGYEKTTKNN